MRLPCLVAAAFALCLASCAKAKISDAECEELFTMEYGKADGQLDFAGLKDSVGQVHAFHTMADGFFYVASQDKLVELNSYGALLYTWRDNKYPLIDVNSIAVDTKKRVYVACAMPEEEREVDESGQVFYWIVLRMSREGGQDDYIGRQGAGGSPFPYIKSVGTTADDELVVVCDREDNVEAWYYTDEGKPSAHVLVPRQIEAGEVKGMVRDVLPNKQTRELLVCADSYEGQEYASTFIAKIDVDSGKCNKVLDIPPYERVVAGDFGKMAYRMPFDFLGVSGSGEMFFCIATDDGFAVQIVSPDGRRIARRNLKADRKGSLYHSLAISDTGIISAMMAKDNEASFMWWRTDRVGDRK